MNRVGLSPKIPSIIDANFISIIGPTTINPNIPAGCTPTSDAATNASPKEHNDATIANVIMITTANTT